MTTSRIRKPKPGVAAKPVPDPQRLLPKLYLRLEKERAGLERWHKRVLRTFHTYERQLRLVARLERRIAQLERA
jgi:hypothetical protein